ncbi:MAG: uracil-DNA glycosylase [Acidobacteria bacterium]|nr:MAG: uracil-DNA glycosylase [Acidobacteriota bacterium]
MPQCRCCPRLVEWREKMAREKVARFRHWDYWGKPVPSLGDSTARLLIVGLAPAAHGGNRTGRIFTGDRSGDWLYRSLYKFGFANQPTSLDKNDGLKLIDCYITAVLHCAPPLNKPDPQEILNCRPYLLREWALLPRIRVIVALGKLAFDNIWSIQNFKRSKRPAFSHGMEIPLETERTLIVSVHPSQQNTFTAKLTEPMFDAVFRRARELIQGQKF